MPKNLIYANADEFHVKSTLVYADGTPQHKLYWDSEHTKPIYSDELKRLFLTGGMKIVRYSEDHLEDIFGVTSYIHESDGTPSSVNAGPNLFSSTLRNAPSIPAGEVHITDDPDPIG